MSACAEQDITGVCQVLRVGLLACLFPGGFRVSGVFRLYLIYVNMFIYIYRYAEQMYNQVLSDIRHENDILIFGLWEPCLCFYVV